MNFSPITAKSPASRPGLLVIISASLREAQGGPTGMFGKFNDFIVVFGSDGGYYLPYFSKTASRL